MDARTTPGTRTAIRAGVVLPLLMAVAVTGAQMFIVSPLMADISATYQASPSLIGLVVSGGSLGTAAMAALAVPVMDRFSRRSVLVSALLLLMAALVLAGLAPSLPVFAVAIALAGAATGIILPTTYALAGDIAAPHERARLLGFILMGWSLSFFLQPFASHFGDLIGWRGAYGVIAALTLATAAGNLGVPKGAASGSVVSIRAYGQAFAVPAVKPLLGVTLCFMFAFYGIYPYLGTAYRTLHGGDASSASLLAVGYGAGYIVMALLSRVTARLSSWRMMVVAFSGLVGTYSLLGLALTMPHAAIAWCVVLGMLNNAGLASLISSIASLSNERRGSILAVYTATTYLGFTLGASTMGPVFERHGLGASGLCSAAAMAVGVVLAMVARWRWKRVQA